MRHLARKHNLYDVFPLYFTNPRRYGEGLQEQAQVDMYLDGMTDIRMKRDPLRYFSDLDDAAKERVCPAFVTSCLTPCSK